MKTIIHTLHIIYSSLHQTLRGFIEFIALLNSRGRTLHNSADIINSFIRTVWKTAIVNRLLCGMFLLFSAVIFLLLIGTIFVYNFLNFPLGLASFYLLSLSLLSFLFIKVLLLPLMSLLNKEKIALLVEQKYPYLNNALISSVQLMRARVYKKKVEYSEQLVSGLIDTTANQLQKIDARTVISRRFLLLSRTILIASAITFLCICLLNRSYFHEHIPLLFSFLTAEDYAEDKLRIARQGPIIGNITVQYRYPLYSGIQSKTMYNTNGNIKALKGSEVEISAVSDRSLLSGRIIVNDTSVIPLKVENGNLLKGVMPLLEEGTYVFETTDRMGKVFQDKTPHTIQIDQDNMPEIIIHTPAQDLVVNERDTIELRYTAKDDFGIRGIFLVYEKHGEKKTRALNTFDKRKTQYTGAFFWSLSELDLREAEKIAYYLEVHDNDTISGPKVTHSRTYYLEIYSSKKKHQELIQKQELLLHEMLYILSDNLLKRIDDEKCISKDYLVMTQEGIKERAERIAVLFEEILKEMKKDPLANYSIYYAFENTKNRFKSVTEKKWTAIMESVQEIPGGQLPVSLLRELQKVQDSEVAEIEDSILFLNDMIRKQRLEDVLDTGKSLIQSQDNIEKLLNEIRKGEDGSLDKKVLKEMKQIEETINQVMGELARMTQQEHMDEFINIDALKDVETYDIMKKLQAMKDAFNKGDMNATLQAARELLNSLQKMMAQMKASSQKFADETFSDMLKDIDNFMDKLSELETREKMVTEKTEKLRKEVQKQALESLEEMFQSFFEKQKDRLATIENNLAETKEILSDDELLQEYLRVNQELRRITEERDRMASQMREFFASEEEIEAFQEDTERLTELFQKNARLNREINADPAERSFLQIFRELPEANETISYLEKMLKETEIKESLELAKKSLQNLNQWHSRLQNALDKKQGHIGEISNKDREVAQRVDEATRLNQKIVEDLESLTETFTERQVSGLTEEDREELQQYAREQEEIQQETEDLIEMAESMSDKNPLMSDNVRRELDMASQSMGGAREKLAREDVQGAILDEWESLYRIAEARKGIGEVRKQISEGMMGEGIPMPIPVPFPGRVAEGQFGFSSERVEIPSEEAYKVPKKYRQDILDALKEGLPEKYRDLNKDYYQKLVY